MTRMTSNSIKIYAPDKILSIGLQLVNFTSKKVDRNKRSANESRFKGHFGSSPYVLAAIIHDLQTTNIQIAKVRSQDFQINQFLMAMNHLKAYPKEYEREATFNISNKTGRNHVWFYIIKVQALKEQKIVWPNNFGNDEWGLTVDGTHCCIREPIHPEFSYNPKTYSHKFAKAGLNYELGISLWSNRLIWMNGPYVAGMNDKSVLLEKGLRAKLLDSKIKAIGDSGYTGNHDVVSCPNVSDTNAVKKFKSRALKRHEKFNGLIKTFECFNQKFRHSQDKFKHSFEAVCVICQYQIEIDEPLFDILIEDVINKM